jgi:hypothetical protein
MFSVCDRRRVIALRQLPGIRMVAKDNLVSRIHHLFVTLCTLNVASSQVKIWVVVAGRNKNT